MDVTLCKAIAGDLIVARNLSSYYIYDMSEHMGWPCTTDGRFGGCDDLTSYWSDPKKHAFMFRAGEEPAGFALILADNAEPEIDFSVTDFFVLRKFRGKGAGQEMAHQLFKRFRGRWKIEQFAQNKPAVAFWTKVVNRYTRGRFEQQAGNSQWGPMNVLLFSS